MERKHTAVYRVIFDTILKAIEGFLTSFYSMIPYSQNKGLVSFFRREEREQTGKNPWLRTLLGWKKEWPWIIGLLLGSLFFFLVPVSDISLHYPYQLHLFLLLFTVGPTLYSIYQLSKERKDWIWSLLSLALGILTVLIFYWVGDQDGFLYKKKFLLFVLSFLGGFFFIFSGLSFSSFLLLSSHFVEFALRMNDVCYGKNVSQYLPAVILMFFGLLLGYYLGDTLREVRHSEALGNGYNLGFYLVVIVLGALDMKNYARYTSVNESHLVQDMVLAGAVIAGVFISVVLTLGQYPFLNREETKKAKEEEQHAA